jgi:hypothetical protein
MEEFGVSVTTGCSEETVIDYSDLLMRASSRL